MSRDAAYLLDILESAGWLCVAWSTWRESSFPTIWSNRTP